MSLRWFVYYCALCGGCAAFLGWALGRLATTDNLVLLAALKGLFLGLALSLVLAVIDAVWNSPGGLGGTIARALAALSIGAVGGFFGGLVGQLLYGWLQELFADARLLANLGLFFGWALTGVLIGASLGVFDLMDRIRQGQDPRGARRKVMNGVIGGGTGGIVGGLLYVLFLYFWRKVFDTSSDAFWSPSAYGFVALGLCIGLLIGLAQVILKEAWFKVVEGFRAGRELIVSKPVLNIGRAEDCDIGLFGDSRVEKLHARILLRGNRYLIEDTGTAAGTYVNNVRISGPTPLNSGDLIRVGRNILSFGERQKHS